MEENTIINNYEIINGDTLTVIESLPSQHYDALITDPPYSSGATNSNRGSKKYFNSKNALDIQNDDMDQRSWTNWCTEWLAKARRVLKVGAPIIIFTDWRQLPCVTDAMQWANFIWRGIIAWDKVRSRPQKGRFYNQCEYCVWGSLGPMDGNSICLPGAYKIASVVPQKRVHLMEKPLDLMRSLVKITKSGGNILDPFCGSGTTLAAALLEGYNATGIEANPNMVENAKNKKNSLIKL